METFNSYQKEAVKLRMSTVKFHKRYANIDNDVLKIVALSYDGLGLGEAGEVQGKIKKIIW